MKTVTLQVSKLDDVKRRAAQVANATKRRYMPPWLPQPGYGVPSNIYSGPVISGGGERLRSTYRGPGYGAPKKKRGKRHRRPRVSSY